MQSPKLSTTHRNIIYSENNMTRLITKGELQKQNDRIGWGDIFLDFRREFKCQISDRGSVKGFNNYKDGKQLDNQEKF